MLRPAPKDAVQAQNRMKLRMILAATEPNRALFPIERIVGHHDVAHTSDLKHFLNEALYRLRSEESPRLPQPRSIGRNPKRVQDGDNAAGGFGNGAVFDKQCLPDSFGALAF